ncbi:MAG: M55 family metallopeptidase [Lachnospiraceae bacterium]|nr:M55 family metallopeptidase [Lachnospiraceae bacterium]
MRFLIMTDIEGVTGITTYPQAENSQLGRDMLMHDLLAVIEGIRAEEHHEIVVYDMHTDGRNVDMTKLPEDINVVMGKPINGKVYRGGCGPFDGLFMVGLHAMSREPGAMLAHSYLREYDAIHINEELVGEIGVERALAGEQGTPLVFVSGDDKGCEEAKALDPAIVTAVVKNSLDDAQAVCMPPAKTREILKAAATEAAAKAKDIAAKATQMPVTIKITYSECRYLEIMKQLYPDVFVDKRTVEMKGDNLLQCWSEYLAMERDMVTYE